MLNRNCCQSHNRLLLGDIKLGVVCNAPALRCVRRSAHKATQQPQCRTRAQRRPLVRTHCLHVSA